MLLDPNGPGFLGAFADSGVWTLGRFTARGTLLEHAAYRFDAATSALQQLALLNGREVVASFGFSTPGSRIEINDASTLAGVHSFDLTTTIGVVDLTEWDPATIAMNSDDARQVVWLDATSGAIEVQRLPNDATVYHDVYGLLTEHPAGRLFLFARGDANIYTVTRGMADVPSARAFERDIAALAGRSWPLDRQKILVLGTEISVWRALAVVFDPVAQRFLPGMIDLGHGVANRAVEDRSGRLWIVLPWSAEIVRITPK
jgi:hypothetical protein